MRQRKTVARALESLDRNRLYRGTLRFTKFSLVGASNAVVDLAVFNLLFWISPERGYLYLVLYNAIAVAAANINSYVWNTLWTFRGRSNHGLRQTALFAFQSLVNVGIGTGLFLLLSGATLRFTGLPTFVAGNLAKVVSMLVASFVSFFILRYLVYNRK